MKIVCVMVTENRAPIWGIGLASFLSQYHADRHLLVILPADQEKAYQDAATSFEQHPYMNRVYCACVDSKVHDRQDVPYRLELGVKMAFDVGADLVAIWDDDDWSPPDRLSQTAEFTWNDEIPSYASYTQGWFVNLRTLRGELIQTLPAHLWGGALTFNKVAWKRAGGFADKPMPGYDRAFQEMLRGANAKEYHLRNNRGDPVAFSHGKNVATWLRTKGTQMEGVFKLWMPEIVLSEVKRCQQLMIDTRTYPPQPEM